MKEILTLKSLITTASAHVALPESAVFMLFFLVFVFVFFFSLIFWRYRGVFALCFVLQGAILCATPFGVAFVMRHFLYPIEVNYARFAPFVYTSGFSFDVEIKNRGKLPIKECMLTITSTHENPAQSRLVALRDTLLPQAAYTKSVKLDLKPRESYRWEGIIDSYSYGDNYKSTLDCH
ncbi:hypothetical protein BKN38_06240 [Helicobacter sp. CLO-3]|uniref:DUF2393 family protein n=1 Tax=unclassified Helicobacter TaxID=2593540 RepID=UPI00080590F9|nr:MULTISPECIES: DUF2393 family protein [unclassified Helicobacter]OBV29286.1 hypothetical protein BA723_06270 [Helicobacter sp. CLO-3]OHU82951.1 hypothetical protein BKN38_06240 [Helicobacter sp. CLO-3]